MNTETLAFLGTTIRVYPLDGAWLWRVSGRWPVRASSKQAAIVAAKIAVSSFAIGGR